MTETEYMLTQNLARMRCVRELLRETFVGEDVGLPGETRAAFFRAADATVDRIRAMLPQLEVARFEIEVEE